MMNLNALNVTLDSDGMKNQKNVSLVLLDAENAMTQNVLNVKTLKKWLVESVKKTMELIIASKLILRTDLFVLNAIMDML